MKNVFLKPCVIASSALLVACGGTGQDDGSASDFSQSFDGVVIDGYLARTTVFLDTNNDGTRNPWEPFAFTDNQGYFSYNPLTDTNYCASDATAEQAQYCLNTNVHYSNVVIRVDSGYDVLTGEPFVGQLSRRLTNVGESDVSDTLISPITSLLTNVEETSDQNTILSTLGLEQDDLDVDYLNENGTGGINAPILNAALKVHKVVAVLSDRLTDTYDQIGEEVGTPNDASSAVYSELAQQLSSSGLDFDGTVADDTSIATVLNNAETTMREIYEDNEFDLPADMGSVETPTQFSRVIDVASNIVDVVNSVVDPLGDITADEVVGQASAIESVVIKALEEGTDDATIDAAADFFTNSANDALVEALITSLAEETADVASLAENDFSGTDFDSEEEIAGAAQLPSDAIPFAQIGGMQIKVSDLDLGNGPQDLDDAEIELYFSGDSGSTSGAFTACVKYIEGATTESLGEGNTRGEIVDGFWSLLGADIETGESYSLLLTLTFLGTTYQAIMKPAGTQLIGDTTYELIRFDNLDEINVWHSELGLVETGGIPQTNEECQERLPSRVGL